MRSFYTSLILALTLSIMSIPAFADHNELVGGTSNSSAEVDSTRQGATQSGKESVIDSSSDRSSSASSDATSESSPFRNASYPGITFLGGNQGSTSNYVKSSP
jgi:hypothetical protein